MTRRVELICRITNLIRWYCIDGDRRGPRDIDTLASDLAMTIDDACAHELASEVQRRAIRMLVDTGQLPFLPDDLNELSAREAADFIATAADSDADNVRIIRGNDSLIDLLSDRQDNQN